MEIVGATIGPGKSDGTQWDGVGRVPQDIFTELQRALQAPMTQLDQTLLDLSAHAMQAAIEKPDPYGWAEIDRGNGAGYGERLQLGNNGTFWNDTFGPVWQPPATWSGVVLHERVLIRVFVLDKDVVHDDPVASVVLNAADFGEVVAGLGHVVQVPVAKQTQGQLLFVGISAIRER